MKNKIEETAGKYLQETGRLLEELIKFPSWSGTGEEEIQNFLADKLAPFGRVEMREVPDSLKNDEQYTRTVKPLDYSRRKNLVLHYPSEGKGRSLIVNSHSDVVTAENWPDACAPRRDGTRIIGRGACDAKGHVATMYLALRILRELGLQPAGPLDFQVVIEEEVGGNGALALIRQGYTADAVIVMESTELKITPANRGAVWFALEIAGKSVHMGRSHEGINAIDKTCLLVRKLREYEQKHIAESRGVPLFEMYQQPVQVNLGVIHGDGWPSMVCGKTLLEGGVGFLPNKTLPQVKQEVRDVIEQCGDDWIKAHYQLTFDKLHNDAYTIGGDHPFVAAMESAVRSAGRTPEVAGFIASCDARLYNRVGKMPTVVFGAGSLTHAHSIIEQIDLTDIQTAAQVLVHTILEWCGSRETK